MHNTQKHTQGPSCELLTVHSRIAVTRRGTELVIWLRTATPFPVYSSQLCAVHTCSEQISHRRLDICSEQVWITRPSVTPWWWHTCWGVLSSQYNIRGHCHSHWSRRIYAPNFSNCQSYVCQSLTWVRTETDHCFFCFLPKNMNAHNRQLDLHSIPTMKFNAVAVHVFDWHYEDNYYWVGVGNN